MIHRGALPLKAANLFLSVSIIALALKASPDSLEETLATLIGMYDIDSHVHALDADNVPNRLGIFSCANCAIPVCHNKLSWVVDQIRGYVRECETRRILSLHYIVIKKFFCHFNLTLLSHKIRSDTVFYLCIFK